MKMKLWLILGTTLSTTLLAQQVTDSPPPPPMDAATTSAPLMEPVTTNKPAAKPARKKTAKPAAKKPAAKSAAKKAAKPAPELKTVPLVAGPAVVVANHVNVRTRAGLSGEVLTKLTNGEPVTVIEEIKLKHSGPEEPSAWAKIALPASAHAWIKSSYIDATNKTVIPKKLNLRGGPSENYGVLGQVQRGDSVTEIETKGEWTQIAPPAGAFAFVAAQYLSQESMVLAGMTSTTTTPPPTPATVTETAAIAATTTETPAMTTSTNRTSEIISNELAAAMSSTVSLAPPEVELPPPPRIVQREGIVRGNTSIQSPTKFELISPDNRKLINYLYTTSTNLDLNRYKGLHIIVTGEEGMDERWKYTPVVTIQRIQVLD
jgi:uncharacterized protein YgiM (DUF1202 family)